MKYLPLLLLCLPAFSQVTKVQTTLGIKGRFDGLTVTATFASTPVPGNVLVAAVAYGSGAGLTADPSWGTAQICNSSTQNTGLAIAIYTKLAGASESKSQSFTTGSDGQGGEIAILYEFSGSILSGLQYACANGGYASPQLSPPVRPASLGMLALAFDLNENIVTGTPSVGWTMDRQGQSTYDSMMAASMNALTGDTASFISNSFAVSAGGASTAATLLIPTAPASHAPILNAGAAYFGAAGQSIQFDASPSIDPYGLPLTFTWNFGDGFSSIGTAPFHAYASTGSYGAILTANNTAGYTANARIPVNVQASPSVMSLGVNAATNGFFAMPGSPFTYDVSQFPVDPLSVQITTSTTGAGSNDLRGAPLHLDGGYSYGMPYVIVDSASTPCVAYGFPPSPAEHYESESDTTCVPMPSSPPIEVGGDGNPPADCGGTNGDDHVIIIDKRLAAEYDFYHTAHCSTSTPQILIANAAIWDLTAFKQRPYGFTSADAAGLPLFPLLVRKEEIDAAIAAGNPTVGHSFRMTANFTSSRGNQLGPFTYPATHASGNNSGSDIAEGMRLRLKASKDISSYSATNQVILATLKKYGAIIADNGTNMFITAARSSAWDTDDIARLGQITAADLEVVIAPDGSAMGAPIYDPVTAPGSLLYDSAHFPSGVAPTMTATASPWAISAANLPTTVTLNSTRTNYSYVDRIGFMRDVITGVPGGPKTYNVTTRNLFGQATGAVPVAILPSTPVSGFSAHAP